MNFLVDHQLPPALARFLESRGHKAQHARELGMKEAGDAFIWRYATAQNMVVVSKDEDFYFLATSLESTGRLVWIRIGNCRKQTLLDVFSAQLENIVAAFESGSFIVEIR